MSGLLLDTSAVIGLFERQDTRIRALVSRTPVEVAVSAITLGELEHGMHNNPTDIRRETLAVASGAMTRLDVDGVFTPSCFGFIRSETGRRVGVLDCWIASSAVVSGLDLVTQDAHLERELGEIDWSTSPWVAPAVVLVPVDGDPSRESM